ncbi:MAG TPA: beta-ketoacyl synthase N-terminal-like domain-containing protein [Thermoanaerobaculia bacterium]|jgi:3-oxoacyl-(acyl-carrier-protein) synthase|nr:beta-ketoacyl synthase N-terminal-like domain-containing protein [Thermoanaerobaculia bacterium]
MELSRRIGVFGWGVVAPRSPDISAFARQLECSASWLAPFNGFGPDNFLVGCPQFAFADYRSWIAERFPPSRFRQLEEKMDMPALYAIGAFIQALGQNPGLEQELASLGTRTHVYVGTGLGNIATIGANAVALDRAQRRWDRFWAERNPELAAFRERQARPGDPHQVAAAGADPEALPGMPPDPEAMDPAAVDREEAQAAWWHFWAGRTPELHAFLRELAAIEGLSVEGEVERAKLSVLKEKQRRQAQLQKRWGAPPPPWHAVSANLVWNIQNTPAAQVSMLGRITGLAFAPVAACSTFGVALKLAMDAIDRGEAKAVVVGATDPPPLPLSVAAFYAARVVAADGTVSKPLTGLRGTHVAGGSVVWIVGDLEHMRERGFRPLGMEPLAVGVSSDADHIITPSTEGPLTAMRQALAAAGVRPEELGSWDLHATATPGDDLEVETLRSLVPDSVLVTARKGTFGHGMSAGGGWELTAQYLGYERGRLYPTPLTQGELNREIAGRHQLFVFDRPCDTPPGLAGKLSMGIGGVNACVISRPW